MEEKQSTLRSEPRVLATYFLMLLVLGIALLVMVLNQKPVNESISYTIELVEDTSTADAVQYTWHVVVEEPVRIKELRYIAEGLVGEAQGGSRFNALEIMVYDYYEYIGHGYTLARVIVAPHGDPRKANTINAGDYDQMSIQWDLREKIWEKQLTQDEVAVWKAWQDYYAAQVGQITTADKNQVSKVIADRYKLDAYQVEDILLKQEFWRYDNFDLLTR